MLFLIQTYRVQMANEVADLVPLFIRYINIVVPKHLRQSQFYHRELVDEFYNSQIRAISFVTITMRQVIILLKKSFVTFKFLFL